MPQFTYTSRQCLAASALSLFVLAGCGGGGGDELSSTQLSSGSAGSATETGTGNTSTSGSLSSGATSGSGDAGSTGTNGSTDGSAASGGGSSTNDSGTTSSGTSTDSGASTGGSSSSGSTSSGSSSSSSSGSSGSGTVVSGSVANLAGAITTVGVDNIAGTQQSNVPVTFGQVFKQGDVMAGEQLVGKLGDGSNLPIQVDVKATHADGSLRHAIISAVLPSLAAGQSVSIGLSKTSGTASSSATAPTTLTSAGFSAAVNLTLGGQVYTASADALLKAGNYTTWLSGPIVNEWHVWAPLKTSGGVEHPHLTARFAIRSYAGMNKARVDVTVENAWAFEIGPQNLSYDAQISVGGQTVYTKSALKHYHHARWRKIFWWGTQPQAHVRHNVAYLIATRAVPNYDQSIRIASSALTDIRNAYAGAAIEPMGPGLALPYMPTTGGRWDIGLLPGWAVSYLLSMDKDAKNATLGTADLAGSWPAHYRDKITGLPVSVANYPYMTLNPNADSFNPTTKKSEAFPTCGGDCTTPNEVDAAHMPAFAYLPYIVTGDYYYLEEMQFYANWGLFSESPVYRDYQQGNLWNGQVRGQAWGLRNLAQTAYITPDKDASKQQFLTFVSNNLDWYNTNYTNNSSANSLGLLLNGYALSYDNGTGIGPWQDDFFTSAVGHAVDMGYTKAKDLLNWKAKFSVGRMTASGYCWIDGSIYSMKVRDTNSSAVYTTFAQAYQASHTAEFNALACNSASMASSLGLKIGEMTGYSSSETGFPSNMQPALAYSADTGIANSAQAWQVFNSRSVKPDYSKGAQFAIVPR